MAANFDPQLYFHVRVVMGMILGLSVTRLLSGFAKFIQHPREYQVSPLHLGWAASTLLNAILFWWWEFRLAELQHWTFTLYFFLLLYTSLFYFMCVLLFPDHLGDYSSYRAYFYDRRKWFFGILAVSHVMDFIDTIIKGGDYAQKAALFQEVEMVVMIAGCVIAISTRNPRYHAAFLILALLDQFVRVGWLLNTIN